MHPRNSPLNPFRPITDGSCFSPASSARAPSLAFLAVGFAAQRRRCGFTVFRVFYYRCGCTWLSKRADRLEYCVKHGEPRRLMRRVAAVPEGEQGSCLAV
jgi:hypothetical protein